MLLNLVFGKNKTVTAELPPKEAEMLVIAAAMYIEDTYADDFDDEDCGYCEEDEEDEEPVKTASAASDARVIQLETEARIYKAMYESLLAEVTA